MPKDFVLGEKTSLPKESWSYLFSLTSFSPNWRSTWRFLTNRGTQNEAKLD